MSFGLPDAVMQGLGFAPPAPPPPPPFDASMAGAPPMPPPMPELSPQPGLPPVLPSIQAPPPTELQPSPSHGDYQVPIGAFTHAAAPPAPHPAAPQRPPTPDQQIATANAAQGGADQASQQANMANTAVKVAEADAQLPAYQAAQAQHDDLQQQLKAQQDDYNKTHAQKQLILDGFNKEADSYKVDQNKYWNDLGIGDKVGVYVGIALSGIGDALQHKTGPNPVIQMLQDKAKQSIQLQMDERDHLEKKAGRAEHALDRYDAFSNDRQAQILAREAGVDRNLARMVQMTMAKFASPEAMAAGQKISADLAQSSATKQAEAAQRAAAYDTQKQQTAIARQQVGIAGGHLALAQRADNRAEREFTWKQDKEQQSLDLQAAKESLAAAKAMKAENSKLAVTAPTADGKLGLLTNKDGSVAQFRTAEIAQKTTDMVAGATAYNRLVGKMTKAIADHGGESTWVKGPEWQTIMSDLQSATAELHDSYGITSFREPTVEFFEKMATSGVDPTSFVRDASAALRNSNKNLQAKVNEKLHAGNYDGPDITFAATDAPAAPPTAIEKIATTLKAEPDQNPSRARDAAFNAAYKANGGDLAAAHAAGIEAAESARSGAISQAQRQGIADLKALAIAGGPEGQAAIDALSDLVSTKDAEQRQRRTGPLGSRMPWDTTSHSSVRSLAQTALGEINAATKPQPTLSNPGPTYDPLGYDPQDLINRFHARPTDQPTFPSTPQARK